MENLKNRRLQYTPTEDKLFNFRPVFFAAVFLCLGILLAYLTRYQGVSKAWFFAVALLLLSPFVLCRSFEKAVKTAASVVLLSVAFLTGVFSFNAQMDAYADRGEYVGEYTVCGTVIDVRENNASMRLILTDVIIGSIKEEGQLVAYLPASFEGNIAISDEVVLTGRVTSQKVFYGEDSFTVYNVSDGIRFSMNAQTAVKSGYRFDLFRYIKQAMRNALYRGMDETSAAVTMGLLTGDVSEMDEELLSNMRIGGIAHVFAVSGLHIGALFAFCLLIIGKTKLQTFPKPVRFLFAAFVLLFYGGVCGYSASVVRAIATCLVFYACKLLGVGYDFLSSLGVAAIIVLLLCPISLFEVGFQLSFAACLGIGLLARPVREFLECVYEKLRYVCTKIEPKSDIDSENTPLSVGERVKEACISFLSVTVAAQLATAPISLSAFGYLSVVAITLNCLFVPLVGAVFAFLLVMTLFATLFSFAAPVILYVPSVVWSTLLLIFEIVDFSKLAITNVTIPSGAFVCYALSLTFLSDKWNVRRPLRIVAAICLMIAFAVSLIAVNC